jgi:hypothetical protein
VPPAPATQRHRRWRQQAHNVERVLGLWLRLVLVPEWALELRLS